MDKEVMLSSYFKREAFIFSEDLGSDFRYQLLLQRKVIAEDALHKVIGDSAWKQYLALEDVCNELEGLRYQTMYLAGASDYEKIYHSF